MIKLVVNNKGTIDSTGVAVASWQAEQPILSVSQDQVVTLTLDATTRAVAADGSRVELVTVDPLESPPPPPAGNVIPVAIRLGPSGATFDPPILLSIDYTKVKLPPNTDVSKLRIYLLVGDQWQLTDSAVDTSKGIVYTTLKHFSDYAIIAPVRQTNWLPFVLVGIGLVGLFMLLLGYYRRWSIAVIADERDAPTSDIPRRFTLEARNFRGRPFKPGVDLMVRLETSSSTGRLDVAADGAFAEKEIKVILPKKTGSQTFYYRDPAQGTVVFRARTDYRLSKWIRSRWPARSKTTIDLRDPKGR